MNAAEEALIEAYAKFSKGPIAVYTCEECGYFHFTSRGPMNERLASAIASGKIRQQQRANHWLETFKKKRS